MSFPNSNYNRPVKNENQPMGRFSGRVGKIPQFRKIIKRWETFPSRRHSMRFEEPGRCPKRAYRKETGPPAKKRCRGYGHEKLPAGQKTAAHVVCGQKCVWATPRFICQVSCVALTRSTMPVMLRFSKSPGVLNEPRNVANVVPCTVTFWLRILKLIVGTI